MGKPRQPPTGSLSRQVEVTNENGIHARPAALFVKAATKFESEIEVAKDGNAVSGKSIMGLMTLAAGQGTKLTVTARGADAEQALDMLGKLVKDKFYEE